MKIFEKYKELLNLCFDKPPRNVPDIWMKLIEEHPVDIISIEKDGEVIGCVTVVKLSKGIFSIEWTAIHPDLQGQGYGKKLMEKAHKKHKGLFIVRTRNADKFYEEIGYKKIFDDGEIQILTFVNDKEMIF
jgi:N-acetylglutamate synthase-like GNAT family acetyltransferase